MARSKIRNRKTLKKQTTKATLIFKNSIMKDKIEVKEDCIIIKVFEGEKEKIYKLTAKKLLEILEKLC